MSSPRFSQQDCWLSLRMGEGGLEGARERE